MIIWCAIVCIELESAYRARPRRGAKYMPINRTREIRRIGNGGGRERGASFGKHLHEISAACVGTAGDASSGLIRANKYFSAMRDDWSIVGRDGGGGARQREGVREKERDRRGGKDRDWKRIDFIRFSEKFSRRKKKESRIFELEASRLG